MGEATVSQIIWGSGACPPEDVGGMHGYQEILEVFKKPGKQRHQEYKEWLGLVEGEKWNADFCSIPRRYSLFEGGV